MKLKAGNILLLFLDVVFLNVEMLFFFVAVKVLAIMNVLSLSVHVCSSPCC